jgi:hypothetical protein
MSKEQLIAEVQEARKLVNAQERAIAKAAKDAEKSEAKLARYPQYVVGSRREASADDLMVGLGIHGFVATVKCQGCGIERTVNTQDVFQSKECKDCRRVSKKARELAKVSEEDLAKELATLKAKMAA